MQYTQKKKLLQAITLMKEGHGLILRKNNYVKKEAVYDILEDLQEMAIKIGEILEREPIYSNKIIVELEEYCEQLYICNKHLDCYNKIFNINKIMQSRLESLENFIKNIEAKIKIVFFPYKFSMWDSLESIWLAADNDKNCLCQVVPIPYYTSGKDGKFSAFHYEGKDFLQTCPIIDYKAYLIEREQPDIVYIHNPYDQYNTVTRLDARFFSQEIKKYNCILVYVPYFLSGYCLKYENLNLHCAKGAINSDFIILQSESLKKAYMYWGFPEKKLLVIGSPKIDAIFNIRERKIVLDENWKYKSKEKKVILLNASIGGILNCDNYISELKKNILEILKRDGLALIWRPHPLLLETINAIAYEHKQQYDELIEIVNTAENAILDNGSYALPAILISDAMISDYSSLILQYTFTGKPVFVWSKSDITSEKYVFCDFYKSYFKEEGITLEEFCDMVQEERDIKKYDRICAISAGMKNTDGTCGEKTHTAIYQQLITNE